MVRARVSWGRQQWQAVVGCGSMADEMGCHRIRTNGVAVVLLLLVVVVMVL